MNDKAVQELFQFLIENHQNNTFLSPLAQPTIDLFDLLDKIADIRGISHEQNGMEYNQALENILNATNHDIQGI
mgnify:CR=1 FL=1